MFSFHNSVMVLESLKSKQPPTEQTEICPACVRRKLSCKKKKTKQTQNSWTLEYVYVDISLGIIYAY